MSQLPLALDETPEPSPAVEAVESLDALDALASLTDRNTAGVIGWAFDCMEMAEEAIEEAARGSPTMRLALNRAFVVLRPRLEVFQGLNPMMVRSHMRELLARIVDDGEDAEVSRGTMAEVCVALKEMSLNAPLRHDFYMVYGIAFMDALGEEKAKDLLGEEMVRRCKTDRDQEGLQRVLGEVAHQMRDEERGKAWKEALA